jgi:hypothetical protein
MALDPDNEYRRNRDIHKEYERLQSIKVKGTNITQYSHEAIMYMLHVKFYLSETTIAGILKKNIDDVGPNQLSLFN